MLIRVALPILGLLVAVWLFYIRVYLPWSLTWGATDEEVSSQMSGDGIIKEPTFVATRAISIDASPKRYLALDHPNWI